MTDNKNKTQCSNLSKLTKVATMVAAMAAEAATEAATEAADTAFYAAEGAAYQVAYGPICGDESFHCGHWSCEDCNMTNTKTTFKDKNGMVWNVCDSTPYRWSD